MPKSVIPAVLACLCVFSCVRPPASHAALTPSGASVETAAIVRSPLRLRHPDYANLARRSERALMEGNVSAARLLLERLHRSGDPDATLLLAKTYDPNVLSRWGVRGDRGDAVRARALYAQARRLGIPSTQDMTNLDLFPIRVVPAPSVRAPPHVVAPPPPQPVRAPPSEADVALIIRRAERDIALGNVSAARLLLERVRFANDAQATLLLAKTYDPFELARWGVRGLRADAAKAALLYERALELGAAEARIRLKALR